MSNALRKMVNFMGTRGGARPGAGRPKSGTETRTQQLVKKYTVEGELTPIDVLMSDMKFFHNLGEEQMLIAKTTKPGKEQAKAFRAGKELKDIAANRAREAAPYIHAKLASIQANVQVTNVEAELAELE